LTSAHQNDLKTAKTINPKKNNLKSFLKYKNKYTLNFLYIYIKYSASLENYSWLSFFVFYGQPSSRVKEWEIVIRRAEGLRKVEARIVSSDDFLDKSKGKDF